MYITHSYIGIAKGRFRCLFFLLLEDYIEAQSDFGRQLDQALERFARHIGDSGVLVRPFAGDIESARSHVLGKAWTPAELSEIQQTPGLLMIDVDFDSFDPRRHRWLFIHLGSRVEDRTAEPWRLERTLKRSAEDLANVLRMLFEAVCDAETDVFESASVAMQQEVTLDFAKVFQAKPGIFGFSIDLFQSAAIVHSLWLKLTKGKRVLRAMVDTTGWTTCPYCGVRFSTRDQNRFDGKRHKTCETYLELDPDGI